MLNNILLRTFSGIYVRNTLSCFKFHIIFLLLCITSKKISVGHESQTNLFHAFDLTFILNIDLVLSLGFKVMNSKKLHSKNLNIAMQIFFNSLTSVTAEFTTSNFIFRISYLCKNRLNYMSLFFLFSSLFCRRKKYILIIGI